MIIHNKRKLQIFLFTISCILLLVISIIVVPVKSFNKSNFTAYSCDKRIIVSWTPIENSFLNEFDVRVHNNDFDKHYSVPYNQGQFVFSDGCHGQFYDLDISTKNPFGKNTTYIQYNRLFFDKSKFSGIPLISIETSDNQDPTFTIAKKSSSYCLGESISNNRYKTGTITIENNKSSYSIIGNIKVRGNTSTTTFPNHPSYKILLDSPKDLITNQNKYEDTEWVLLNDSYCFYDLYGYLISKNCGIEWQPRLKYVNVILNGNWKGLYCLSETIKNAPYRCEVGSTGYIFENDAYWWNSNNKYFKTKYMDKHYGFTMHYPEFTEKNSLKITSLQKHIQKIENLLIKNDPKALDYLDIKSFAAYTLARDILGVKDAGGSNMYFCIPLANGQQLDNSKIKLGPLWDFDTAGLCENEWSGQHKFIGTYTVFLWNYPEFVDEYCRLWESIKDDLSQEFQSYFQNLTTSEISAINESRKISSIISGQPFCDVELENKIVNNFIKNRIAWISKELN